MTLGRREWKPVLAAIGVAPTRLPFVDLLRQARLAVLCRPGRSFATALGTVVGVAAVVATIGISSTASVQVTEQFDALRATTVILQSTVVKTPAAAADGASAFSDDGVRRLGGLNGVVHAGVAQNYAAVPLRANVLASDDQVQQVPMLAAEPAALEALHVHLAAGRLYDDFHEQQRQPVALLGRAAATNLGITRIDNQPAVFVGTSALTVIGIVDDAELRPGALLGIFVPARTGRSIVAGRDISGDPEEVVVETAPGAAQMIAEQGPTAVNPVFPHRVKSLAPPDPKKLRRSVESDVNALFLILAAISLVIGTIGISNTTLVAVIERVPEIGLRRALGAGRRSIAAQFLTESSMIGTVGGVIGCSVGTLVVVGFAATRQWSPSVDPRILLAAPLLGTLTGLVAGLQPAWRATRIEPTDALRR